MNEIHFSSETVEWETPRSFFDPINFMYDLTLDVCATPENAKCRRFFTKADNGLLKPWFGERVWMNPPYGRTETLRWVRKAYLERNCAEMIIGLVPSRTDTQWFHKYIWGVANSVHFIEGRLKFGGSVNAAPFPSLLFIYRRGDNKR